MVTGETAKVDATAQSLLQAQGLGDDAVKHRLVGDLPIHFQSGRARQIGGFYEQLLTA